jgi:hypothetical protein
MLQRSPSTREVIMDKVWLYIGGIVVGAAVVIFVAISIVNSTHPPASDLRGAYEKTK